MCAFKCQLPLFVSVFSLALHTSFYLVNELTILLLNLLPFFGSPFSSSPL